MDFRTDVHMDGPSTGHGHPHLNVRHSNSPPAISDKVPRDVPSQRQIPSPDGPRSGPEKRTGFAYVKHWLWTFGRFVGPGFMIAVSYIDPGNYATDIAAGATYRFDLLFIVLLSNLFAIFLQALSVKLGTVTGMNLAEACRAHLPRWLNWALYVLAEVAIIATDMAEVIGTAIALNLLSPKIPLVAGCALGICDVMVILFFYRPEGSMRGVRFFEYFVMSLVVAVVVCFCFQMAQIKDTAVGEIFRGYLPNDSIVHKTGLYQACGILGATVMPHSLYLGSGIVQSRLREYDTKHGYLPERDANADDDESTEKAHYVPSLKAIRHSIKYAVSELSLSLFTFALFINSAILIVAGSSLYGEKEAAAGDDIFAIHDLLSKSLGTGAGTVFALALLLSGISAGIVCTIAGQMVSEGALNWKMRPWLRRLCTRSMSITPAIIVAGAVGQNGLSTALNWSQVILSIALPFITAPLIYFTCLSKFMTVRPENASFHAAGEDGHRAQNRTGDGQGGLVSMQVDESVQDSVNMKNGIVVAILAVGIWLTILVMNGANVVLLATGEG